MSLINILKKKTKFDFFTTPSHSQKLFIFSKFRQFYKYDISETDALNPQDALILAEKRASEIYKTKSTHFLTNGSTSGIIAAVLTCVEQSRLGIPAQQQKAENVKVLVWDKAHPCHKNAIELAGADPIFYELEKDEEWGIYKAVEPENIETICKKEKIKAVIITSPTYEGIVSDIPKIKEICQKYGAYLIVDEAHGALYPFSDELPESAIYQGADFVIQSLHKTAGGLNPTALLHIPCHCETKSIDPDFKCTPKQSLTKSDIKSALEKISTTSPSYPLLASIEKNINYLNSKKGRAKISELIKNIKKLKTDVKNCEFHPTNDPTKILIKSDKMSGFELSEFLYKNKIEDEKTNEKSTMLLCGIGTDLKKLNRLKKVLKKIKL